MATAHTHQDFKLVIPDEVVESLPGDDVTLGCHLSPSTSAVAMEIRWFKRTNCIYWYANGHVTVGGGYEDRVSVSPQQLQRGDVSLTLRGGRGGDEGVYTCQVISGEHTQEGRVRLGAASVAGLFAAAAAADLFDDDVYSLWPMWPMKDFTAEERKRMEESVQSLVVQPWRKASDEELMQKIKEAEENKKTLEEAQQHVKMRDSEIERRDRLLQDRDKQIETTDKLLEKKDLQIKEGEKNLKEKMRLLEESKERLMEVEKMLMDRNKEMEKTKGQLEEKSKEVQKIHRQLEESNRLLQERETALEKMSERERERETALEEMSERERERETALEEMSEREDRNSQLQELRTQLLQKERELEERDRQLEERDRQMEERGQHMEERDRQRDERDRQMEIKKGSGDDPPHRMRRFSMEEPPTMGGESPGPAPPVSPAVTELRLVLLGGSAAGKRAAGNTILGTEEFGRQASTHTLTHTSTESQHSESRQGEVAGRRLTVVETPDWFCSGLSEKDTRQDVGLCVRLSAPGPQELQDRNSQLLQELRSQLLEKERELEERERQLEERERQMKERDRQLEERERQLEEGNKQLTEREKREMERREGDDPGPPPIRRRQSCPFLPPTMGAESRGPGVLRVRVQSMLEGVPAFIRRNSSGWLLHYITSNI